MATTSAEQGTPASPGAPWRASVRSRIEDRWLTPTRSAVLVWYSALCLAVPGVSHALQIGYGYDSHAYWLAAGDLTLSYTAAPLERDAYLYSPVFAQLLWPLAQLPWPLFAATWSVACAAAFLWLVRPLPWRWRLPALVVCLPEVITGNVYSFMALAIVLGTRRAAPWLVLGLTKALPGAIGAVWLIARGSWRDLALSGLLMALVIAPSMAADPAAWGRWTALLLEHSKGVPAAPVLGLLTVWLAARTGRPWLLPVAAVLCSPTFGMNTLTLLAAVPRLVDVREPAREQADDARR